MSMYAKVHRMRFREKKQTFRAEAKADAALADAAELLVRRGLKLTSIRRSVLGLLCREQKAFGAYDLVTAFAKQSGRRITPCTVYRVRDFLEKHGLVAHLANSRDYVARRPQERAETSLFFVCSQCGVTTECQNPHVERVVHSAANAIGFVASARAIDVEGMCKQCSL
jgi:Fur family zinc uptake transcriptional regulator